MAIKIGDIISNPSAGERNPTKIGLVIKKGRRRGKSSPGPYVVATDLKGLFWELSERREINVIGRIDADQIFRQVVQELEKGKADAEI